MFRVDLNCDLGESFGIHRMAEQDEILQYVTSVNVACGFHSGDPTVMRETVEKALENGVRIGAHPGLPDLQGFGRREMSITAQEAYDMVVYQIGALQAVLASRNASMQHVKPHGALYNMAARDGRLAEAIAQAIYDVSPDLILFGLAGSELIQAGERIGLRTAHEVFADRTYQADGSLTSRKQADALITDVDLAKAQVIKMIKENKVMSQQATEVSLQADTICVHGDSEQALQFVKEIKRSLEAEDISVEAIGDWKENR